MLTSFSLNSILKKIKKESLNQPIHQADEYKIQIPIDNPNSSEAFLEKLNQQILSNASQSPRLSVEIYLEDECINNFNLLLLGIYIQKINSCSELAGRVKIAKLNLDTVKPEDDNFNARAFSNLQSIPGLHKISLNNTLIQENIENSEDSDEILKIILNNPDLKNLVLGNTAITPLGMKLIAAHSRLESLELASLLIDTNQLKENNFDVNQYFSDFLNALSQASNLKQLILVEAMDTVLHEEDDFDIRKFDQEKFYMNLGIAISKMNNLKFLKTHIDSGYFIPGICQSKALEILVLSSVEEDLIPFVIDSLKNLHTLQHLSMQHNTGINGEALRQLATITSLRHLDLSGCKITEEALLQLATSTSLRYLNLTGCKITEKDVEKFFQINTSIIEFINAPIFSSSIQTKDSPHLWGRQSENNEANQQDIKTCNLYARNVIKKDIRQLSYLRTIMSYEDRNRVMLNLPSSKSVFEISDEALYQRAKKLFPRITLEEVRENKEQHEFTTISHKIIKKVAINQTVIQLPNNLPDNTTKEERHGIKRNSIFSDSNPKAQLPVISARTSEEKGATADPGPFPSNNSGISPQMNIPADGLANKMRRLELTEVGSKSAGAKFTTEKQALPAILPPQHSLTTPPAPEFFALGSQRKGLLWHTNEKSSSEDSKMEIEEEISLEEPEDLRKKVAHQ